MVHIYIYIDIDIDMGMMVLYVYVYIYIYTMASYKEIIVGYYSYFTETILTSWNPWKNRWGIIPQNGNRYRFFIRLNFEASEDMN